MTSEIDVLVDRADLDGLVRVVDGLCATRSWSELLRLRDLCREAARTGRQVWPIATLCEYRLALHAPAEWACRVVEDQASRFSLGPLTEVVAQNHSWTELAAMLSTGPSREIVAHERSIRGDDIDASLESSLVLDVPFALCDWEPAYPIAEYSDEGVSAPSPSDGWTHEWFEIPAATRPPVEVEDGDTDSALRDLVEPWTSESAGRARCLVVEGGLEALASSLDRSTMRFAELTMHQALQWLAWCAGSSGSHGRRRGMASGRFGTWWILAAIADLHADWDELRARGELGREIGRRTETLRWYRADVGERHSYELSLAVVDDEEGLAFGLLAFDDPQ